MLRRFTATKKEAQTAVEYMVLLGAVVSIVLIGFKTYLPTIQETTNYYYNQVGIGVFGEPSRCGDGSCDLIYEDCIRCPSDCPICTNCTCPPAAGFNCETTIPDVCGKSCGTGTRDCCSCPLSSTVDCDLPIFYTGANCNNSNPCGTGTLGCSVCPPASTVACGATIWGSDGKVCVGLGTLGCAGITNCNNNGACESANGEDECVCPFDCRQPMACADPATVACQVSIYDQCNNLCPGPGTLPVPGAWVWQDNETCGATTACQKAQTENCIFPEPLCPVFPLSCPGSGGGTRNIACGDVDGGWTSWFPSTCPASCSQTRTCTNPTPMCSGLDCSGLDGGNSSQSCAGGSCSGCTPDTCAGLGFDCGSSISDNCGGTLSCGTCTSPNTCGGGGTANACGCARVNCVGSWIAGTCSGNNPPGCTRIDTFSITTSAACGGTSCLFTDGATTAPLSCTGGSCIDCTTCTAWSGSCTGCGFCERRETRSGCPASCGLSQCVSDRSCSGLVCFMGGNAGDECCSDSHCDSGVCGP